MNINQKLRYMVNTYWDLIWIKNLYTSYKKYVLKVWNASSVPERKKQKLIQSFAWWIEELEDMRIDKKQAKQIMERLIEKGADSK